MAASIGSITPAFGVHERVFSRSGVVLVGYLGLL